MKTKLLLMAILFASFAFSQTTLTIGSDTSSSATRGPFQRSSSTSSSVYSRASMLYSATELASMPASSTISQINFDLGSTNVITASGDATMTIYMKNSSATEVVALDSSWDDAIAGATIVGTYTFNTTNNFPGAEGFMSFVLSTGFNYTGGALEIAVDWDCSGLVPADAGEPNLLFSDNGSLNWHWSPTAHQSLNYRSGSSSAPSTLNQRKAERVNTQIVYTGGTTPPAVGQIIGEFPIMDGGFENQTAGNLSSQGSSASGTASTSWSISTTGGTTDEEILDTPADARTGSYSAQAQLNIDRDNARLQSPSTVSPNPMAINTEYTVQFFYKSPTAVLDSDLKPGVYLNNTSGGETTDKTDVDAFVADTWIKTYGTITTGDTYQVSNWAVARIGGPGDNVTVQPLLHFDDFVVYAGSYDDTAPNAPTGGTYDTSGNVGWSAPAGGVDGGGYVVIKYTSMPNADNDPNQNGIYNVGNTTTNGSGGLTGTVVYIGTDTSFTDVYSAGNYYKIYAVDKAFNYSDEIVVSDATLGLVENEILDFRIYPNPASDFVVIEANTAEILSVDVYDILGKKVLSEATLANKKLNVSSLKQGVYFIRINALNKSFTKRVIIE
ncbi:T9SS type A sorting domain-containing protein [Winogradskyella pulchriflava]|uniref:T9SS type A sorting domain-containing protein n=1 Tax=Winogradskyella pulchriflava TaxID=1110688 RepID=A0ABV6QCR7_9FLAO